MFAPEGYRPMSMLWDQFLDAKIDAIYRSASAYYASKDFAPGLVRGSPLDIAEHIFLELMCKCEPRAVSANGNIMRVHTRYQDGVPGLFTQIAPRRSALDAVVAEINHGNSDEIDRVAGPYFEVWYCDEDELEMWRSTYPKQPDEQTLTDTQVGALKFHTLPICYERSRFMIVEALPHWARTVIGNRDLEIIVNSLSARALCIPEERLEGWERILNGKTPILEDELQRQIEQGGLGGRPSKLPKVIEAYNALFPDGHSCSWKEAANRIEKRVGEPVSVQTLRRAVTAINSEIANRED